jgi:spore maturation protein CgeB
MKKKILILDGISGISLGKEIDEAFHDMGNTTDYIAADKLPHKFFYKPETAIKKIISKHIFGKDFYRNPKIKNSHLIECVKHSKPDIIFVIGFLYRFFDLKLMQQLKEKNAFKLYLYDTDSGNLFNNKRELVYFFNEELPLYDHIYSFSKTTTNFINKLKTLHASYFPFGAKPIEPLTPELNNPEINNKVKEHDILFVGSADMRRIYLLEQLTPFKLSVYGSKWKRNHSLISPALNSIIIDRPVWGNELHQLLFSSKIILNITRSPFYAVETGINLRIFETLAAQRFLLTDYTPEIAALFKIGEEIETYISTEELLDKVAYYLKHADKRNKIAQQGHAVYLKKYTWNLRIKELLSDFNREI